LIMLMTAWYPDQGQEQRAGRQESSTDR